MKSLTALFRKLQWLGTIKTMYLLGASFGILLFCSPALSQLNLGRIFGGITDQSGGVVPGVTVTVTDVARGVSRTLTTDSVGEYSAPSLTPGTYLVRAEAKGFRTIDRQNIILEVGQDLRVDLSLQPGEQTQTVTVTESLPVIQTTSAQLGETLDNQTINELPVNGREYEKLLTYRPGVKANGMDIYFNGNRSDDNSWMFDGLEDFNEWAGTGPVIGGQYMFDEATIMPIDAIQEVNVIEVPKAEYGWKPGAEVNVGLKSGTNSIHGTAFAFGRDTATDARNPFLDPALPKNLDTFTQYGASIGGPIKKDKLFFFGAYEGQRATVGEPRFAQIPAALPGAGPGNSLPDAIADLKLNGVPLSQLSLNLAGCTANGACNAANGLFLNPTNSGTVPLALNNAGGSDNGIEKIDYHPNDHNSLNGEFAFGQGHFINAGRGGTQPYWLGYLYTRAQVARAVWIWTPNSAWVNEARFGYDRMHNPEYVNECPVTGTVGPNYAQQFGFVSGATFVPPFCGFPRITIGAFDTMGANTGQNVLFGVIGGADSVSYTHGKHLFKFGAEIHRVNFTGGDVGDSQGVLSFRGGLSFANATPLEDFLAGQPASGKIQIGSDQRNATLQRYASFVQDDWRVFSRVIVNLGLRWEYSTPFTERNNLLGNFDPTAPTGLIQAGQGGQGREVYHGDRDAFAPRLGLAWDVTGKGTTVLRAGFSIVYNTDPISDFFVDNAALPLIPTGWTLVTQNGTALPSPGNIAVSTASLSGNQIKWAVGQPVFNSSGSALQCGNGLGSNPSPCSIQGVDPNLQLGYVSTWNLAIQHAFPSDISATLAYVGSRGTHLGGVVDINQPIPGATNGGSGPATEAELVRRPYYNQFPYLGQILYFSGNLGSSYNTLQASLTKRFSKGLSFTAGYSYSHSITQTDAERGFSIMDSANTALDRSSSIQDPFTHFSFSVTYNIPGKKSPLQLLEGWQLNSIVDWQGGVPYPATDGASDISGTGEGQDRWTLVGNYKDFKVGSLNTVPCFGVSGSNFGGASNCTQEASVSNMPAACQTAAAAEPTGPGGTTGTQSLATWGCYMQGSAVIVPPAQGTFGSMARGLLRAAPIWEWDFSVSKGWKFRERLTAQFRAEFFNVDNHIILGSPSSDPTSPGSFGQANSLVSAGNPLVGSGAPREVQFGLKLIF